MSQIKYGVRRGMNSADANIRKVASTFGKTEFNTYSPKANVRVVVESPAERTVAHLLAIDPEVRDFKPQPFTVDLNQECLLRTAEQVASARKNAKARRIPQAFYTPDFVFTTKRGLQTAVEVKLENWLGDASTDAKHAAASRILMVYGVEFLRVIVPSSPRPPLANNAALLHIAMAQGDMLNNIPWQNWIERRTIEGAQTLGEFCCDFPQGTSIAPLLLCGALSVDVHCERLHNGTPACAACGCLDHLSLIGRLAR